MNNSSLTTDGLRSQLLLGRLQKVGAYLAAVGLVTLMATPAQADDNEVGATAYQQYCAQCHEGGVAKAPHKMFLEMMSAPSIFKAMHSGIMQAQSAALSDDQKRAIAEYLTKQSLAELAQQPAAPMCTGKAAQFDMDRPPAKAGWGVSRQNQRFISKDIAGLEASDLGKLKLKWAFRFPNTQRARSQPTVAMGAVFVGSQDGTVYALDKATGCVRWTFQASAEVRTPVIIEGWEAGATPDRPLAYFADLIARVYAVDARTGELVWVIKADDHPNATVTGAPVLLKDRLYVPISSLEVTSAADPNYPCCTFRGAVMAVNAQTGETAWKTYTIDEEPSLVGKTRVGTNILAPSGAPVWNSPSIDEQNEVLYVGTGENYSSPANDRSDALIAFDLKTGKMLWHRQKTEGDAWNVACMMPDNNPNCPVENGPDVDFGAATIIARDKDGRDLLLAGQKSGDVYALDPRRNGEPVWGQKVGRGGIQGGVHFGMALDGQRLFVPISDMSSPEAEVHLHAVPSKAGIYALDVTTGEFLWSTPANNICSGRAYCEPGISAAITAIPGAVIAGHMDGRLRAYASDTGQVIWEFDSTQTVNTTDGATATGGSFGGSAGPIVQDGMLFAASGYGVYFHMPGNVLLAFGLAE